MAAETPREQLAGLIRYDALVLTALIWFLAKFLRYSFPPLFEPFQSTYGASNDVLGLAFTTFMLVYAAMQFPSGVLADRVGSVTVITGGVVLASSASLVLLVDSPFIVLVVVMALMGAGTGAHKTVAVRLLARAYPARTGRALGVLDTVGAFGGVAAPAVVVFVAAVSVVPFIDTGWRQLFFLAGLVGLALAVAFAIRVPKRLPSAAAPISARATTGQRDEGRTSEEQDDGEDQAEGPERTDPPERDERPVSEDRPSSSEGLGQYLALFRDRRFSGFVLATICFSFTYNGLVAFAPLYLIEEAGLATTTASLLYSALFAVSLVQLVTGEVSDHVGTLPVIVAALAIAAGAMIAFVSLTGTGSAVALGGSLILVGVGAHGFRPVRGAYLMETLPSSIAGGSLGVVRTLLMGAGAVAPAVVGVLSTRVGFRHAFWLLAASMTVATLACALLLVTESRSFRVE